MAPSVSSPSYQLLESWARRASAPIIAPSERGARDAFPLSSPPVSCFRPWSAQSRHTMPSEETASLSKDAWSNGMSATCVGTASLAPSSRRRDFGRSALLALRIQFLRLNAPRRPSPTPLSSIGNPSHRPTCDAKSRRSCARARPWPASIRAVSPPPWPRFSAEKRVTRDSRMFAAS